MTTTGMLPRRLGVGWVAMRPKHSRNEIPWSCVTALEVRRVARHTGLRVLILCVDSWRAREYVHGGLEAVPEDLFQALHRGAVKSDVHIFI